MIEQDNGAAWVNAWLHERASASKVNLSARPKPRLRLWPQHDDDEATDDSKDGAAADLVAARGYIGVKVVRRELFGPRGGYDPLAGARGPERPGSVSAQPSFLNGPQGR